MSTKAKEKVEYAGHSYCANVWIKIGLDRRQAKALRAVADRLMNPGYQTSAHAARMLITTALAHYDAMEEWVFQDQRYAKAEGFNCRDDYQGKLACRKLGLEPVDFRDGRSMQNRCIQVEVAGRWMSYQAACRKLKQVVMKEAANLMMARKAAVELQKVKRQFPGHAVRVEETKTKEGRPY